MNRESILRTAFRVWGREFYQSTSLTELARELGVSKPALYRHFRDKQALMDAMYGFFFDDYARFIRPGFEAALAAPSRREGLALMIRNMTEYYVLNRDFFLFSIIQVYGNQALGDFRVSLRERGLDTRRLWAIEGEDPPFLGQMVITSLGFHLAVFHRAGPGMVFAGDGELDAGAAVAAVLDRISRGLALCGERIAGADYAGLEDFIAPALQAYHEDDGLLKAVASVVAEVGPWDATMDMVARRSGLSKSGLYAHFKNKQDMIRQFFLTEFDRIAHYAELSAGGAPGAEERLYLIVFAVASYLRANPEILIGMDWYRTRRAVLEETALSLRIFQIITDAVAALREEEHPGQAAQWILALIINTLMGRPQGTDFGDIPNGSIRRLYRFIALGLEGFDL